MSDGGKGSLQRPVDKKTFDSNWDKIFNNNLKVCTKCRIEKDLSNFGKCNKNKNGLKEICKECRKKESKEYYLNKDKQLHLLETLRGRAKANNLGFNLEYSDLTPPAFCPVFKTPLNKVEPYSNNSKRFSMSIDRIDSTKGYTKDNIQIISQLANVMKHDANEEELLLFADWIINTYRKNK